jgi:hypothetical protein
LEECEEVDNIPPGKPSQLLVYPITGDPLYLGETLYVMAKVIDPDGDNINIFLDVDGDNFSECELRNVSSDTYHNIFYKWDSKPAGTYYIRTIASDLFYNQSDWSEPLSLTVKPAPENNAPNKPTTPSGVDIGNEDQIYTFKTYSNDPDGDKIKYQWDFGDGTITKWDEVNWVESGTKGVFSHIWSDKGSYKVKVRVKDINGNTTQWSGAKTVDIKKSTTATIFTLDEFGGATCGDEFNLLLGTGRLADANGSTGTIVTGAYGGFPAGYAWSQALQGCRFYVGREKTLTIDAEFKYVNGGYSVLPLSWTWIDNIIKIKTQNDDGIFRLKKEFKDSISDIGSIEDLQAFATGVIGLAAQAAKKVNVHEMIKNMMQVKTMVEAYTFADEWYDEAAQYVLKQFNIHYLGEEARWAYLMEWEKFQDGGTMFLKGGSSTTAAKAAVTKAGYGSMTVSSLLPLWLILTVIWEVLIFFQLYTHWEIDTLLEEYEDADIVNHEHYIKSYTFDEGNHTVWAGLQTSAQGLAFFFGFAYAAGIVRSITIEGISPPETPTMEPVTGIIRTNQIAQFKAYCVDHNDDPVRYIIDWGDGTNTISEFFESEEEAIIEHVYKNAGEYTITVKSEDCDKRDSEESIEFNVTVYHGRSRSDAYVQSNPTTTPTQQTLPGSQQLSKPSSFVQILKQTVYIR